MDPLEETRDYSKFAYKVRPSCLEWAGLPAYSLERRSFGGVTGASAEISHPRKLSKMAKMDFAAKRARLGCLAYFMFSFAVVQDALENSL